MRLLLAFPRPSTSSSPRRSSPTRRSLAAVAVTGVLLAVGGPAAAHDVLLSSDPEDGASLEVAPEELTLTFNNPPSEIGAEIVVLDADGVDHASGDPVFDGTDVRQEVDPDAPAGEYHVQWRVVSSDGHAISGELAFTVRTGPEPEPEPAEEETAPTTEPEVTSEPDPEATTTAADGDGDPNAAGEEGTGWPAIGLTVAGLAVLAAVITLVVRRSRS